MADDCQRFSYAIGRVLKPHGLLGDLLIQLFRPREPEGDRAGPVLLVLESGERPVVVYRVRYTSPTSAVIHARGIDDREAAERCKGAIIRIDPNDAPALLVDAADRWFGAEVVVGSQSIGVVKAMMHNGAQIVLSVGADDQEEVLIPFVDAFIERLDVDEMGRRTVHVRPVDGLLEVNRS